MHGRQDTSLLLSSLRLPSPPSPGTLWTQVTELGLPTFRVQGDSPVAQSVRNPPAMQETWVRSLGWEDPLEEGMATHSSILAWRIPWTEELGRVQSMRSQRVRHNLVTKPPTTAISAHEKNHTNDDDLICIHRMSLQICVI